MKIYCTTNLDINEDWPTELPCRPMVGDYITSRTEHPQYKKDSNGFSLGGMPTHYKKLTLVVCSVTFKLSFNSKNNKDYKCYVELTIKNHQSIRNFYEWYAPMVGKSVSSFI